MARRRVERIFDSRARLLTDTQVAAYLNCGTTKARQVAEEAKAVIMLGASRRVDRVILDQWIDAERRKAEV